MNKRNFGRVIKRIEANPAKWNQLRFQTLSDTKRPKAYCFLCHAEYVRTSGKANLSKADYNNVALCKWLGLTESEAVKTWICSNTLADFKRWHKAGRVS